MIFDWIPDLYGSPVSGQFKLVTRAQVSASPYTGAGKANTLAQLWKADLTFNNKSLDNGVDIQAFIEMLEGPVHVCRLWDFWREVPPLLSGGLSGFSDDTFFTDGTGFTDGYAPSVVTGATRGARFLQIGGLPEAQACFRRGDLIGVGGSLQMVSAGVTSNAAGEALLPLLPGLRSDVAASDPVILWRPKVPMRLMPDHDGITREYDWATGFSLSFIEDIP